jgi:hypothetical protein
VKQCGHVKIVSLLLIAACALGCSRRDEYTSKYNSSSPGTTTAATTGAGKPRFVHAGAGDAAAAVRGEMDRAKRDGRSLLVYVGATWCEPCKVFHRAIERGDLDKDFPTLTMVEFDRDNDDARLNAAGYRSAMIPLFAAPNADGTMSTRFLEGSIKGEGATAEITPRLRALLTR